MPNRAVPIGQLAAQVIDRVNQLFAHDFSVAEGLGYEATRRDEVEFITGGPAFAPTLLRIGLDGALYVLDAGTGREPARIWRVQHRSQLKQNPENLAKLSPGDLVRMLEHPNRSVRMVASRRILEERPMEIAPALSDLVRTGRLPYARLHALWGLQHMGLLAESNLLFVITNSHQAVQKSALRIAMNFETATNSALEKTITKVLGRELDDRSRLRAVLALEKPGLSKEGRAALVKASADFSKDASARSAVLGVLRNTPLDSLKSAFSSEKADALKEFVTVMAQDLAFSENDKLAAEVVLILGAAKGAPADPSKAIVLESFDKHLTPAFVPQWTDDLAKALKALIGSQNHAVKYAALPLAVHWDVTNALAAKIQALKKDFFADLENFRFEAFAFADVTHNGRDSDDAVMFILDRRKPQ